MKNLKFIYIFSLLAVLALNGCKKDYDEVYDITYYPTFKMAGDAVMVNPFGTAFTDPGAKATEAGQEIPVTTTVTGDFFGATSFNPNMSDRYIFTYAATNSDGYPGTVQRVVYNIQNGDLVNNIEGIYTATVVRNGVVSGQYADMEYVVISKTGDNTYMLSDAIGGYYDIGRLYGATYRAPGLTITANNIAANNFSFGTSEVGTFGGVVEMKSMTVDPASKTIVFTSSWDAGYNFEVTLKQVQL